MGFFSDLFRNVRQELKENIMLDDIQKVKELLDENKDLQLLIDDENPEFQAVVDVAVTCGCHKALSLLFERGANADPVNEDGFSSLMFACMAGSFKTAELLLKHGANINKQNEWGMTALGSAALGTNGRELVLEMLENDYGIKAHIHESPRHSAIVEMLITNGANVNPVVPDGRTPLFCACGNGDISMVQTLLKNGAKIDIKTQDGRTPVSSALEEGHTVIVKMLQSALKEEGKMGIT